MSNTRAIIESALRQNLVDDDQQPVRVRLLPGLSKAELNELARALPVPPTDEIRQLLEFCSGIDGTLEQIDFSGRTLRDAFGAEFLPYGLPIAHDGCGNYRVVDFQPGDADWGPIYYCCHDAPVMLLQAATVEQFVNEVFKMYISPHISLINDVHEDRLFDVWRKNSGVVAQADAIACADSDIRAFAATLGSDFEIIDLRSAPIGMGFSWGRYGPRTEVKRFGPRAIFAYRQRKEGVSYHAFWGYKSRIQEDVMRKRNVVAFAVAALLPVFSPGHVCAAEQWHLQQITVNGKSYNWPKAPVVVVLIDGGDPTYVNAGLAQGLLPNFKKFMTDGFVSVALGAMPAFTNPNNVSVITGVPPSVHGISGNFFLNPTTGQEMMMDQPEFLRADSILAKFSEHGAKVVAITAKNKLAKILAYKLQNGITFSSELADKCTKKDNGIDDCLAYVGRPLPNEYSADLSLFVLEAGVKILEREKPDLMYLSLSDYIQHKYAPGSEEANEFYAGIDSALGRMAALGATIGLTADHGMNDKSNADGSPNVVFLQDVLDKEFGNGKTRVILPITDPYIQHHGALGSYATIFFEEPLSPIAVMNALHRQPGVELVMDRASAARTFDLPADRIGDLIVVGDRGTVLGKSKATLDLSMLRGMRLRSHGGLADRNLYLIFSRPLNNQYANIALSRQLRNFDVFDFVLNGLR